MGAANCSLSEPGAACSSIVAPVFDKDKAADKALARTKNERGAVLKGVPANADRRPRQHGRRRVLDDDSDSSLDSLSEDIFAGADDSPGRGASPPGSPGTSPRKPKPTKGVLGKHVRFFKPTKKADEDADIARARELAKQAETANGDLLKACRAGDLRALVNAMDAGAEVHALSLRLQTPLMLAASANAKTAPDCIKFLIEANADVEMKDDCGWTALLYACRTNSLDQAALLIGASASVKARANDGKTPAMLAALEGGEHLVHYLVEQRAQLDKKDEKGWTVLFFACADGRVDLTKWLLKKACNPKEKAWDGTTPLMCAVTSPNGRKVAQQLVKRTCGLNQKTKEGNTALMAALKLGKEDFAEWIMEEGCDCLIKNNENEDAIDICEAKGLNALKAKLELRARIQAEKLQQQDVDFKHIF